MILCLILSNIISKLFDVVIINHNYFRLLNICYFLIKPSITQYILNKKTIKIDNFKLYCYIMFKIDLIDKSPIAAIEILIEFYKYC